MPCQVTCSHSAYCRQTAAAATTTPKTNPKPVSWADAALPAGDDAEGVAEVWVKVNLLVAVGLMVGLEKVEFRGIGMLPEPDAVG